MSLRYENRVRRAGLPTFIDGFAAYDDVYTRALPFLALVTGAEIFLALDDAWPVWAYILASILAVVFVYGGVLVMSRIRSRQWTLVPDRIGPLELAIFVLAPAIIDAIAGDPPAAAILLAVANCVILVVVYLIVGFGLVPTALGAIELIVHELGDTMRRLARALPVLLIFSLVLFISTEMWQIFGGLPEPSDVLLSLLFLAVAIMVIVTRAPASARAVVEEIAAGSPTRPAVRGPGLSRMQWSNLAIVLGVGQLVQIAWVCAAVGLFFMAFGVFAMTPQLLRTWNVDAGRWQVNFEVSGQQFMLASVHVRVSVALAVFTGLYYAITMMADSEYLKEYRLAMADRLAPVFQERADHLAQ